MTSIIEVPQILGRAVGKTLRNALALSAGTAALNTNLQKTPDDTPDFRVTKRAGKKGRFGRRLISYKRAGPFHRQIGTRTIEGVTLPMMETFYHHNFMHATKGRRRYVGGPSMRMPVPRNMPQWPFRFFGRNHLLVSTY